MGFERACATFLNQPSSARVHAFQRQYEVIVWWSAPVEVKSAFARLLRMGLATSAEFAAAHVDLDQLRHSWTEVQPSQQLREDAEALLDRFPLKAADALQLAAAYTWAMRRPAGRVFLCGDLQLLDAARMLGFQTIAM